MPPHAIRDDIEIMTRVEDHDVLIEAALHPDVSCTCRLDLEPVILFGTHVASTPAPESIQQATRLFATGFDLAENRSRLGIGGIEA